VTFKTTSTWASAEIFQAGSNVDISFILYRLPTMQR